VATENPVHSEDDQSDPAAVSVLDEESSLHCVGDTAQQLAPGDSGRGENCTDTREQTASERQPHSGAAPRLGKTEMDDEGTQTTL